MKKRFSEEQIIGFLQEADAGMSVKELGRKHGFSDASFRDECLNEHWFSTLAEARAIVSAWRRDYNEIRPHSSIGYQTPAEYGARHRSRRDAVQTQEIN